VVTTPRPFDQLAPPPEYTGHFRTDELARALYSEGAGIARSIPAAVAVPASAADVSTLVRWAKREGHGLIPRGSGSGMAAGAVGPSIVVDLSRFAAIGEVDEEGRRISAGCGALRGEIDAKARLAGLRFPVDPSSGAFCTIGGMAGTNAAGARSLRFGAMRSWTTGLHCVFDDGSSAWIRRGEVPPAGIPAVQRLLSVLAAMDDNVNARSLVHSGVRKESSGYFLNVQGHGGGAPNAPNQIRADAGTRLIELLVGSEGTIAMFTEVELALTPVAGATATVLAVFSSLDAATACAVDAREAGASTCELLDRTFLDVAASAGTTGVTAGLATSLPAGAEAVLLCEVEATSRGEAVSLAESLAVTCRVHGAIEVMTAVDASAEHRLWALRHAASPILARLAPRLRSMQFIEDGCVPPDRFPEYVRGVRAALARSETLGVIFGHAGDSHAHVNPLIDVTRAGWRDRMRGLLDDVCDLTARCGGTLAGEHGDGRLRAPLLARVWSDEARAAFTNIKAAGDPAGVFNPGCKISRPGDDGLASIRYDPDSPPLDPRARAALDSVERDRAWHRFRLGLARGTDAAPVSS
jgi:FAD/FMN-containing dehydrogenase